MSGGSRLVASKGLSRPVVFLSRRRYLDVISKSAEQAGELIDDLLAFSRMNRAPLHRTAVDMNKLVRETLNELKFETEGRNVI